ncbi:MAG: DNA-binding protein [Dehalococcoidia bacterium]|nr:DNA-binding protein [Dehalococcoidia bacterium]
MLCNIKINPVDFPEPGRRTTCRAIKDDYVTASEAANLLGVDRVMLYRWVKKGTVRAYSLGPRPVHRERVEADMKNRLGRVIKPLNEERAQQALAAMRAGRELGERINERRNGKPWAPSWDLINEARDEPASQLL